MVSDEDRAAEYRGNAARCLQLASEAYTLEGRSYWVSQAQFWHGLAHQFEGGEPAWEDGLSIVPSPPFWMIRTRME